MTRHVRLLGASLAVPVLALVIAGCGSSEDEAAADPTTASTSAAAPTTAPPEPAPVRAATIDMGAPGEFDLIPEPGQVDAGKVTFTVANDGTIEHEVLVMRTDLDSGALPTTADGAAVEENVMKPVAMHGEDDHHGLHVAAGEEATMTVDLPAGEYALICNLPGHYAGGMHANLRVS